ncbi:MAG: ATP phosphoribosyltransferase [Candidatus Methanarcanum hacksteinii]|uniref:ATP phosphoribosyltransferase n=1 Tax=Candidatus Methanarcanum hacksteinii TaxID=2911857 RepID=UPI0015AC2AF1|nr:ATP phosphoribosyltransferase [Methanomassiliicoccales archaeon]MDY4580419.1 ATP phosphoribosyltransferase [Candidatus Methanarcanum hacksteinii]TQS77589.1 MAG: ATP phosphoribosyltransferase [Candidatus Methanarcanum hacksteinii]
MTFKMAVPNKGRLHDRTIELLLKSGLDLGEDWGRRLYVTAKNQDIEILFVRAQDIPRFIAIGSVDLGITGQDQIADSGFVLKEVLELEFGHCRLSVAVPEQSNIRTVDDIKDGCRVATSFPNVTKRFFDSKGKNVEIVNVSGAAEIMPYIGVSDIIVDLVSSGATLKTNRLMEIETLVTSQAVMVTSEKAMEANSARIMDIVNSVKSVIDAENKKYLMADVPVSQLPEIDKLFPGLAGPTVMNISGRTDMVAIHVVVDSSTIFDSVNKLQKLGAKGILTLPIERLVP